MNTITLTTELQQEMAAAIKSAKWDKFSYVYAIQACSSGYVGWMNEGKKLADVKQLFWNDMQYTANLVRVLKFQTFKHLAAHEAAKNYCHQADFLTNEVKVGDKVQLTLDDYSVVLMEKVGYSTTGNPVFKHIAKGKAVGRASEVSSSHIRMAKIVY